MSCIGFVKYVFLHNLLFWYCRDCALPSGIITAGFMDEINNILVFKVRKATLNRPSKAVCFGWFVIYIKGLGRQN